MKVALTDRHTGETHTLKAAIENRVGFSLRGHLYLAIETRPGSEITWELWNDCKGVLVASTPQERKRFDRWVQCGRDYASRNRRKRA